MRTAAPCGFRNLARTNGVLVGRGVLVAVGGMGVAVAGLLKLKLLLFRFPLIEAGNRILVADKIVPPEPELADKAVYPAGTTSVR